MIVLYTFDFKKGTTIDDKKHQFMMLLISIQSVIDTKGVTRIVVYTNDKLVEEKLHDNFREEIQIIFGQNKKTICDTSWFTCAGHSRLDILAKLVSERHDGGVLYMDNDTIAHPDLFNNISHFKRPTLYRVETWHDLKIWCFLHTESVELYHYVDTKLLPIYNYKKELEVINNGVIYLPNTSESVEWIKLSNDVYKELMDNVGYSYGLDQTSMSISCHIMGIDDMFYENGTVNNTVWHAYCVKDKYKETIDRSRIKINDDFKLTDRFADVYRILFNEKKQISKTYPFSHYKKPFSGKH